MILAPMQIIFSSLGSKHFQLCVILFSWSIFYNQQLLCFEREIEMIPSQIYGTNSASVCS